ncbi:MAG: hypothetical protein ACREQY_21445, partial [Candidatus Binatia bacterium]
ELLDVDATPGLGSRLLASAVASVRPDDGVPVIYYRRPFDPFTAIPLPSEPDFEPPGDSVFPSLFRRSLGNALSDTLRYEIELRDAMKGEDAVHLVLLLLDGELRLRPAAPEEDDGRIVERIAALGFGPEITEMVADNRSRSQVLLHALAFVDPPAVRERLAALRDTARAELSRWESYQRQMVREAVRAEARSVQELRYLLEFELSQTLASRKAQKNQLLQGTAPTSSAEGPPRG